MARPIDSRTLNGVPDVFTRKDTTYLQLREMAVKMRDHDHTTPAELGLAIALIAVIEDFNSVLETQG